MRCYQITYHRRYLFKTSINMFVEFVEACIMSSNICIRSIVKLYEFSVCL